MALNIVQHLLGIAACRIGVSILVTSWPILIDADVWIGMNATILKVVKMNDELFSGTCVVVSEVGAGAIIVSERNRLSLLTTWQ